nr:MAG TPA: hypothetical protein [Caudoviricetes sp.]
MPRRRSSRRGRPCWPRSSPGSESRSSVSSIAWRSG